jgi:hypothetical protein
MANDFSAVAMCESPPCRGFTANWCFWRMPEQRFVSQRSLTGTSSDLITDFVRRNVHIKPANNHCTMVRQIKSMMTRS